MTAYSDVYSDLYGDTYAEIRDHIYFQPPTTNDVPPIYLAPDRFAPVPALSQRLFRHYASRPRGRNIYRLSDGTITETEPYGDADVVAIYFGGHLNVISEEEAAVLDAAGYSEGFSV